MNAAIWRKSYGPSSNRLILLSECFDTAQHGAARHRSTIATVTPI